MALKSFLLVYHWPELSLVLYLEKMPKPELVIWLNWDKLKECNIVNIKVLLFLLTINMFLILFYVSSYLYVPPLQYCSVEH